MGKRTFSAEGMPSAKQRQFQEDWKSSKPLDRTEECWQERGVAG